VPVGHRQHVGRLDALPAANARAVKTESFVENVFGQLPDGAGEMLPGAKRYPRFDVTIVGSAFFASSMTLLGVLIRILRFF